MKKTRMTIAGSLLGCAGLALAQMEAPLTAKDLDKMLGPDIAKKAAPAQAVSLPLKAAALDLGGGVTLEMLLVPAGTFTMGRDGKRSDAAPAHPVTLTKPFWIGKCEVTQEQWKQVMGEDFPSAFTGPKLPVDSIAWEECQPFLDKLNALVPGGGFRLPTEAEWEYACRAGSTNDLCCGTDVDAFAWYNGNSKGVTHPVGEKKPNAWGLHDMHGNVMEWCYDVYGPYSPDAQTDPKGPNPVVGGRPASRVQRSGGCYPYNAWMPPSGNPADRGRGDHSGARRHKLSGLRVARDVK